MSFKNRSKGGSGSGSVTITNEKFRDLVESGDQWEYPDATPPFNAPWFPTSDATTRKIPGMDNFYSRKDTIGAAFQPDTSLGFDLPQMPWGGKFSRNSHIQAI